jgi:hypothetical protein
MDSNIYGKDALKVIEQYDTIVMGRLACFRCTCGHDFHIAGKKIKEPYTYKNDINRVSNFDKVAEL